MIPRAKIQRVVKKDFSLKWWCVCVVVVVGSEYQMGSQRMIFIPESMSSKFLWQR
jgi:hypothetical protein